MKCKQKRTLKNTLILTLLLLPLFFVSLDFSSVYCKENSFAKTEKLNSKLTKIEKSNLDEKSKLEKSHAIYKKLAESNPEKYLTQYLKSSDNLASYYGQINYRLNATILYKETIKTYEKIISKNPQLINKEAIHFYKGLSTYYNAIHQPSTCIQYIEEGLKQTNYLLETNPNGLDLLKLKNELLRWYLITSINYDIQSGNINRCLDFYNQSFENSKQLILQGLATSVLSNNLRSYSNLMIKNYNFSKADEKYNEYIEYFRKLSYKNSKYKKNYADLLISKNYSLYAKLSDREREYNFNEAKNVLVKSYDLSTVDGMKQLYRNFQEISYIYESNQEHLKAEESLLQGVNIYNKYTYPEMEQIPYLKYRYLEASEDLIMLYKRNHQKDKVQTSVVKLKDACSYFAQKDEIHIKHIESCNGLLSKGRYYGFE